MSILELLESSKDYFDRCIKMWERGYKNDIDKDGKMYWYKDDCRFESLVDVEIHEDAKRFS